MTGITYQGGHFRIDATIAAQPDVTLYFTVPEPSSLVAGADIAVAIDDGWVIPGGTGGQ